MGKKIKVSAVSYLNTKPFLFGLEKSGLLEKMDLSLDIPSQTAAKLIDGSVDLGLVPVAILPTLKADYQVVSDFCIGTNRTVKTVGIYSQQPLETIEYIYLDYHSRTSIQLAQLLCREHWQLHNVTFLPAEKGFEQQIKGKTAAVIIGDRAIRWRQYFKYEYDLGEAWYDYTGGLPFVFAAWVTTNPQLSEDFIRALNAAFRLGLEHIDLVAKNYQSMYLPFKFSVYTYFSKYISYHLDESKKIALQRFLTAISTAQSTAI